ncbi:hypothetical protein MKW94_003672 [Papaver nudicaule]|uniref:Essential protein Yae1 N-terminal domain-containing protein n=1 Tax=Papaver nudicaule TaxID=74823 RepID=A0AA41W1X6_PAPNU|nr:hypothetical protein [Papaver nudicaule]
MESLYLDPWDSINCLDDTYYQEGINAGYKDGLVSGEEGKQVELGYYQGCLDVWNAAIKIQPSCFSSRVQENIKRMNELIKTYPVFDPENQSVQDIMEDLSRSKQIMQDLRSKYRLILTTPPMKKLRMHGNSLDSSTLSMKKLEDGISIEF